MTETRGTRWLAVGILLALSAPVSAIASRQVSAALAQPPAPSVPAQPAPTPPAEPAPEQAPVEIYAYDPAGRRDPFVSLLNRGAELRPISERPQGLSGLSVNEVALRGIVASEGQYLAVLQAPDAKTYIVRVDDRLLDGSVRSITADAVVFLQDVNDPLSVVKEREVRKNLRGPEERQ